jgi:hypothetical protein
MVTTHAHAPHVHSEICTATGARDATPVMYGLRWAEGYGLLHRHRAAVWECLDHTDIASTMNQADELKSLFEAAGFRNCHLKHNPPSDGFQQLEIHGFPSTQAGGGPELVAPSWWSSRRTRR